MDEVKLQEDLNICGKRALATDVDQEELTVEQQQRAQNTRAAKAKPQPKEQMAAGEMAVELAKLRQEEANFIEVTVQPSGKTSSNAPATSSSSSSCSGTPAVPRN